MQIATIRERRVSNQSSLWYILSVLAISAVFLSLALTELDRALWSEIGQRRC
jgi:hypothetical protein